MASIVSNVQQHQQCCRTGLVDVAGAHVQQAVCSRRSACQASKHADGKPMSAARQHKHTCFNPAALVAHGASSPSSCPIPPAVSIPGLERHVLGHHERTRPSFDTKPSTPHDHGHALDGQGGQERRVGHARCASGPLKSADAPFRRASICARSRTRWRSLARADPVAPACPRPIIHADRRT